MSSLDPMSRRDFLDRTLKIGAAGLAASGARLPTAIAAEGERWQIGCYTRPWAQYDYRVALDAIAEAGFKYAGLMTTKAKTGNLVISVSTTLEEALKIDEEIRKRGLKVPSVYGGGIPVNTSL
ncbi:MAG: hypothetical protein ACYTBS_27610, partial [Planctomycetota bacterium]